MEVTRKNFQEALPMVKKSIDAADFLVIDTEFTGLMSGRDVTAFDSPPDYYKRLVDGASDFLLIQYGLAAFYWDPSTNSYMNDTYNFYVYPRTRPGPERVFLCQSSSLEFLALQGFNFNKLLLEGIPYLTEPTETALRERLQERQKTYSNSREGNIAIPAENRAQIEEICGRIEKFLAASEPEWLEVDRCNAFIRKLVFQEVERRFKDSAYIETKVLDNKDRVLRVTRMTSSEESGNKEEERKRKEWEELEEAVGFSKVTRMITESEKLVIGHNMLLDVLHTLNQFYQPLPDDYTSFKEFAHCMFPRLLDTKYMCSLPPFKDKVGSSMLPHLLATLSEEPFTMPSAGSLEGRGYTLAENKRHEAGYDAYITGLCFLAMHAHLARACDDTGDASRVSSDAHILKPFINKLYLSKTAYHDSPYMNLAGKDPEPSRDHVFHICFPKQWTRNDIVQMFSPYGPVFVQFLDDVSALVALVRREHARSAARSLAQSTAKDLSVHTYAQYIAILNKGANVKNSQWLSKERLDEYRRRAEVIASTKASPVLEATRPGATDDGVSTTTTAGFLSLKVDRKRTSSASSAEARPPGRKRTSSGLFVVDTTDEPLAKRPTEPARVEPPEHGLKIERIEVQTQPNETQGKKERKISETQGKKERKISETQGKKERKISETQINEQRMKQNDEQTERSNVSKETAKNIKKGKSAEAKGKKHQLNAEGSVASKKQKVNKKFVPLEGTNTNRFAAFAESDNWD